nr:uncharacterized protein LOC123767540 [Procambarus clarkii]
MQHNQVLVIQVSSGTKLPLALPAPQEALLPSEVKYSASLVRGLGFARLILGAVLFLLGVLGSWVEPETCWSGAGVWAGLSTICCGISGLLAHRLWYKNFTIKAFLVSSVASVIITILAIILTIYAIVNRQQHYFYLLEQAENNPWFQPYDLDKEHRLTLSVSANQLVGFCLELMLALWSTKVGWRGVRAPEFSAARRDTLADDCTSVASLPRPGQQVPLAALYHLLQAHPELLGNKAVIGSLGTPWSTVLDERPPHHSMDYQERVSRFLSHAIEEQNMSFSRSPSTLHRETRDASSPTVSSMVTGSGRGSPAETVIALVGSPEQKHIESTEENFYNEKKQVSNKSHRIEHKNRGEHKIKAPAPKINSKIKENEKLVEKCKPWVTKESKVINKTDKENKDNAENVKKSCEDTEQENKDELKSTVVEGQNVPADTEQITKADKVNKMDANLSKTSKKAEEHKIVKDSKVSKTLKLSEKNTNQEQKTEGNVTRDLEMTKDNINCIKEDKVLCENENQSAKIENNKDNVSETASVLDHTNIVECIQPPCEFQDNIVIEEKHSQH